MPTLSATPCNTCRKRHLKCDGTKPVCSRCRRLKRTCTFPGLVVRSGLGGRRGLKFPRDQIWPAISKSRLQFIDESGDLANYYGHDQKNFRSEPFLAQLTNPVSPVSTSCSSNSALMTTRDDSCHSLIPAVADSELYGYEWTGNTDASFISSPIEVVQATTFTVPAISHPISLDHSDFWPQRDFQEAYLIRYFVEELAPWFDSCDLSRQFALVAPYRISSCPALLYAICSASARHMSQRRYSKSRGNGMDERSTPIIGPEVALEYQNLCISHLMSLSGDPTEVQDENLLAAAVILRFYEELDVPLVGVDEETYLRGTQVFLEAQASTAVRGHGLQNAAFWVGLRQEFHRAFMQQRAFRFDLSCCSYSRYKTLEAADDFTWANRVVLHCAETLIFCYGTDGHDPLIYNHLWKYNKQWDECKPSSFNPIYYNAPDRSKGEVFPQIWYIGDCQVTAIQHWHLARILLSAFDPTTPRIGPNQKRATAQKEAEIKKTVFELCGIACSNKTAPGLITACMGVSLCGDQVADKLEQKALLQMLVKTEEIHALSTSKAQRMLKEAWDWSV